MLDPLSLLFQFGPLVLCCFLIKPPKDDTWGKFTIVGWGLLWSGLTAFIGVLMFDITLMTRAGSLGGGNAIKTALITSLVGLILVVVITIRNRGRKNAGESSRTYH